MPEPRERTIFGKEGSGLAVVMLFLAGLFVAAGAMIWVAASVLT